MILEYENVNGDLVEIDTKEYVELLDKSIEHYQRMIEWAKAQDQEDNITPTGMYISIRTNWLGHNCNLCTKFKGCNGCPIFENNKSHRHCRRTPWADLNRVENWGGWLIHANEELALLTMLRDYYDNR